MEQEGKPVQPEEVPAEKQQSEKQDKKPKQPKQPKQPKPSQKPKEKKDVAVVGGKKQGAEIIGITVTKDANFSQWYQELVTKAEMVEYYNEVREPTSSHAPYAAI
jgi:prolyl-tRNA synthetase